MCCRMFVFLPARRFSGSTDRNPGSGDQSVLFRSDRMLKRDFLQVKPYARGQAQKPKMGILTNTTRDKGFREINAYFDRPEKRFHCHLLDAGSCQTYIHTRCCQHALPPARILFENFSSHQTAVCARGSGGGSPFSGWLDQRKSIWPHDGITEKTSVSP